ncbi:BREX-2 system phosphatase PglZ [Streptomyces sp. CBMA29]|uniref:BREX-2 system phosphatase PglZ n=1 Tax=Streptomyces sp. CBMA29 TaxID=1896314 RepID=UPI0016618C03|nr:BREX-2 system phosphatase PglZ [Streptomyces sp. CBMA29]MBD0735465.1 hypothetical protein [Streptomyces sp. CBMA29]
MPTVPPPVNRLTIEALLETYATKLRDHRLMLVHGHYQDRAAVSFTVKIGDNVRRVHVSNQSSVLGIVDAWQRHRADASRVGELLVVTSDIDDTHLGWDVRGQAVKHRMLTVQRPEIVKQRFGARELDPRIYRAGWLLEALLEAEPTGGWQRSGSVLTYDAAVRSLLVARLGLGTPGEAPAGIAVDADALLTWSRTSAGPARFLNLRVEERAELTKWLIETAGPAVPVLMSLVETGRGDDAMARGLLGAAMAAPESSPDTVLAVGGLLGQVRRADVLAFSDAVAGTLTRWIGEAAHNDAARRRVLQVIERADLLAEDAGLTDALRTSRFLLSSFDAQLRSVADGLARSHVEAESALGELEGHALAGLFRQRIDIATMAVRIRRWIEGPQPAATSVAHGVHAHLNGWGWADRALHALWSGDPARDPAVAATYRTLYDTARARRDLVDEQFANRLAGWTRTAEDRNPGNCLLVEHVLAEAAEPLCQKKSAPLILLLDGMSSAVAVQLGEEAEREGWIEAAPVPRSGALTGRLAAVSMLPSVTRISRASLLSGKALMGGQSVETAGFTTFWKQRRRTGLLFHKSSIQGPSGHRLSEELAAALASDAVVGAVLNTIDDALDHGQQGERAGWRIGDISFLRELLTSAKAYGRPVLLVADHGHVLEHGTDAPRLAAGAESSRWRTGSAGDGEIELSGPRVLEGDGTIVVPWREDIRYTPRKAGYHGGASLAEVTVPLLVLLPEPSALPEGWQVLPREAVTPGWWSASTGPADGHPATIGPNVPVRQPRKRTSSGGTAELFAETDVPVAAVPLLGSLVVASSVYKAQREYVRLPPEDSLVAAVIDALADAGEHMSPAALAAAISATSRVKRNIDGFIATLQRLLNVEGYPVLAIIDSGHTVKLDVKLLRTQFQLEGPRK